jgi:hypothetical protein
MARDRTASELEMGGRAGEKKSSGGDGGGRRVSRLSVASVNASAGGMSMDHHAAETVAGSLRRHISESEGVRRAST